MNATVKAKFSAKQAPAPKNPIPPIPVKATKEFKPLIPVRPEGEFMTAKAPEITPIAQFIA